VDEKRPVNRHIPLLDGLRGLAIIAVVVCHVNWAFGGPFIPGRVNGPLATVFGWGWIGVDLFFVLSGFLITGILYDAKGCAGYFRNFYARRTLRIMPLYFGFLLFIVVLNRLHATFAPWLSLDDLASLASYTYNFRVAFTESTINGLHHFWSLAVEEHFYLLWPLAVWGLSRRPLLRLCLVVAVISFMLRVAVIAGGAWPPAAFFMTPCRLDGLLAGSLVALARRDEVDWAWLRRGAGTLALASGCLLLGIALGQRHFIPDVAPQHLGVEAAVNGNLVITVGIAALAVFFAALIALAVDAAPESRLRQVLERPWLRAIGKYSYAVYVFHALILAATMQLFSPFSEIPQVVAKPLIVLWVLAVSFLAAWLSYHLYEKHFLRLKRFFEYRKPAAAAILVPSPLVLYRDA
jgi:peptidoglycan/LPS O-acetylase OafA/YrhL